MRMTRLKREKEEGEMSLLTNQRGMGINRVHSWSITP
jgi:hypothetical protein